MSDKMNVAQQSLFDYAKYSERLPKKLRDNLAFRKELLVECRQSESYRQQVWKACSRDPLFFFNGILWTHNPKASIDITPFITWKFQDRAIFDLVTSLGMRDVAMKKPREMGVTHIVIGTLLWAALFRKRMTFRLVSRKEELVDSPKNDDSLFAKIDFYLKYLPEWMRPDYDRLRSEGGAWVNKDNGSRLKGESTNDNIGRGGRDTAMFLDEFGSFENGEAVLSSTRAVTDCRIFVSTVNGKTGPGKAFYDICSNKSYFLMPFNWWDHPVKGKDQYTREDGKISSPWYEFESLHVSRREMARNVDCSFEETDSRYFSEEFINDQISKSRGPLHVGELHIGTPGTTSPTYFKPMPNGKLKLWCNLNAAGRPMCAQKLAAGADISQGMGVSNSALVILDASTGEMLAEFATPYLDPPKFAHACVSILRWFGDVFFCWEAQGPGTNFAVPIRDLGYTNVYYHRDRTRNPPRYSDRPGWHDTREGKSSVLADYRSALISGRFQNNSADSLRELSDYVFADDGEVEHNGGRREAEVDPSGAKKSHGDRTIAALCALLAMYEMNPDMKFGKTAEDKMAAATKPLEIPDNCLYRRMEKAKQQRALELEEW